MGRVDSWCSVWQSLLPVAAVEGKGMAMLYPETRQCPTGVQTPHMLGTASSSLSCQAGSRYQGSASSLCALTVTGTIEEVEGWAVTLIV